MGIFSGIKRRKAEKALQLAQAQHAVALAEWQKVDNQLAEMIVVVRDCIEGRTHEQFTDMSDYGFMLDTDEFPVATCRVPRIWNLIPPMVPRQSACRMKVMR